MFVEAKKKMNFYRGMVCLFSTEPLADIEAKHNVTKELPMLGAKQQWCLRCQRHVQTEQKQSHIGKQRKLVKIIVTCGRCRITLSSKTTSAAAVDQNQSAAAEE